MLLLCGHTYSHRVGRCPDFHLEASVGLVLPPRLLPRQPLQLGTQCELNPLWTSEVGIQTQSEFSTSVFGEVKPSFGFCCAFFDKPWHS